MSGFEAILRDAEKDWRQALSGRLGSEEFELATHPERAAFIQLLRARAGGCVLEISPGWGGVTVELARAAFRVVALEPSPERARFIELRAKQEGLEQLIEVRRGAAEDKFDAIVSHEPASSTSVAELGGKLAPGGVIYLGGPGRRPWSGRRGFSHAGYVRIFSQAGLRVQASYASPRGFRNPSELVPMQEQAIRYYTRMRLEPQKSAKGALKNLAKQALASSWCWERFGHDFVFFLEADDA